jgi:chaperonin GroEL (HSP60 family)
MHDALMVVKRSMKACEVVAGGGAIEVSSDSPHSTTLVYDYL